VSLHYAFLPPQCLKYLHRDYQQCLNFYAPLYSECCSISYSGYWARLEKFVRDLPNKSKEEGRSVYVCTGPLYVPTLVKTSKAHHSPPYQWEYRHRALGSPPQWLAVPTHFFKVKKKCQIKLPPLPLVLRSPCSHETRAVISYTKIPPLLCSPLRVRLRR
jgi:hypothetical protein